jgi:hypothetical protein
MDLIMPDRFATIKKNLGFENAKVFFFDNNNEWRVLNPPLVAHYVTMIKE